MIRAILTLILLSGVTGAIAPPAFACPTERPSGDIIVALRDGARPFSYFENGRPAGFVYDLWKKIEPSLSVPDDEGRSVTPNIRFVECDSIDAQEVSLVTGVIDVVISPLTITSQRMQSYDFSQQYLSSGLAVAVPPSNAIDFTQAKKIVAETILNPTVARAVLAFLTFNLIMAILIRWFLLSHKSENASHASLWMWSVLESIVRTVGLRGVGDGYTGAFAKVLEIFLAVVGTALSATLLGVLTSAFVGSVGTQQSIPARALTEMSVATLDCSTAQTLLRVEYDKVRRQSDVGTEEREALNTRVAELECVAENAARTDNTVHDHPALRGSVTLFDTWEKAVIQLADGQVDAIVGDWIALTFFSRQDTYAGKIDVLPSVYQNEPYGWGISRTSVSVDLRRQIDRALIQQMRNRNWRKNIEDVLGTGSVSPN